jgi:hypothetical protein
VLGFAAAALAALGTLWQVSSARAVQREVSARQVYAGVLRLAFDHPDYAEPVGDIHQDPQHAKRYAWFVSNILNSLEEILLTVRGAAVACANPTIARLPRRISTFRGISQGRVGHL